MLKPGLKQTTQMRAKDLTESSAVRRRTRVEAAPFSSCPPRQGPLELARLTAGPFFFAPPGSAATGLQRRSDQSLDVTALRRSQKPEVCRGKRRSGNSEPYRGSLSRTPGPPISAADPPSGLNDPPAPTLALDYGPAALAAPIPVVAPFRRSHRSMGVDPDATGRRKLDSRLQAADARLPPPAFRWSEG